MIRIQPYKARDPNSEDLEERYRGFVSLPKNLLPRGGGASIRGCFPETHQKEPIISRVPEHTPDAQEMLERIAQATIPGWTLLSHILRRDEEGRPENEGGRTDSLPTPPPWVSLRRGHY